MGAFFEFIPYEKRINGEVKLVVERFPELRVELTPQKGGTEIRATIDGLSISISTIDDLFNKTADTLPALSSNIKGAIGERLLSITMEYYLKSISQNLDVESEYGIIKESEKHKGKGFISVFNDKYLLRFKGKYNFVILQKQEINGPSEIYQQEKMGLTSTEIDALGYLHNENKKYLVIGEASMKNKFHINSNKNNHALGDMNQRIFTPLRSLLPDHDLIYLVMSSYKTLFEEQSTGTNILKKAPSILFNELKQYDVPVVFIPVPKIQPSITDIANQIVDKIQFTQSILGFIKPKYY